MGESGTTDAGTGAPQPTGPVEFQVNTTSTGDQYHAQFTQLASGGFVAIWNTAAVAGVGTTQLMCQKFDAGGQPIGPEVQVSTGSTHGNFLTNGVVAGPVGLPDDYRYAIGSVVELVGGGYVVSWTDVSAGYEIHARIFDAAGNSGPEFVLNTATSANPQVTALANGGFALVYQSTQLGGYNSVFLETFDSQGTQQVTATLVDNSNVGAQGVPTVVQLDNGNLFVTWTSQGQGETVNTSPYFVGNVFGRIIDISTGSAVMPNTEFLVNTSDQVDSQQLSKVVPIAGGFVVVWQSWDPANITANEIRLQRYFNDGSTNGTMFTVNTTTAGNQNLPEIAVLADGGYVVVWQSELQDGSGYGIYQQRFDANGVADPAGETQVNVTTTLDQRSATISALADGGWVVGYNVEGGLDGEGYGIFAVRFDADGIPVGQAVPYVAGNDYLDGGFGNDSLYGNAGDDTMLGGAGHEEMYGGDGNDDMDGGYDHDLLNGGDGDDLMNGQSGHDALAGGSGADSIEGGAGDDVLAGGGEDDELSGSEGNDVITGDAGNDWLAGGTGRDDLYGGTGNDHAEGGFGNDLLYGGNDTDTVSGNGGQDQLFGGNGDDLIIGGNGKDTLRGGGGKDELQGGNGHDRLIGGSGADTMTGGDGTDVFVFNSLNDTGILNAADTISDFMHLVDKIDLSGFAGTFSFIGAAGFSGSGPEVRYSAGVLQGDANGNGGMDFSINLTGDPVLTATDFIL